MRNRATHRSVVIGFGALLLALTAACTPPPTTPPAGPVVRVLYVRPTDRAFDPAYSAAIGNAVTSIQSFYRAQLGGKSFTVATTTPEQCLLPHDSAYYVAGAWDKVYNDVQACAPVGYASPTTTWVLYVDVIDSPCLPGRLGAGTTGITMMPRADLEGLIGHTAYDACGGAYTAPIDRWIGGLGHELGHAFGLAHPAACDAGLPSCDTFALMWLGYSTYPDAHLRDDDKATLLASPFFT